METNEDDTNMLSSSSSIGHHKATEEEGDQGILGEELWRKKCGQQDTSTAREDGGGSTRQSWMETSGLWTVFHRE